MKGMAQQLAGKASTSNDISGMIYWAWIGCYYNYPSICAQNDMIPFLRYRLIALEKGYISCMGGWGVIFRTISMSIFIDCIK